MSSTAVRKVLQVLRQNTLIKRDLDWLMRHESAEYQQLITQLEEALGGDHRQPQDR